MIDDLSFDHTPVLLTLSASILKKNSKQKISPTIQSRINMNQFRIYIDIDNLINFKTRLQTCDDLIHQSNIFIDHLRLTARNATPKLKGRLEFQINVPCEIRELIKERRRSRR